MRGLENRIKALEERIGMGRKVLLCLWGDTSQAEIRAAVRVKAKAEGVSESQVTVITCRWMDGRDL